VSTPRLRAAFRFQGQILELGYPRNDVLSQPRQQRLRRKARRRLGLDEDATVVLYAPTWRDDEYFAGERAPVTLGLDVGELGERLGDDVTLLVRTHNMMTGRVPVVEGPRVRDMSRHPDIRDLHVVADALVTDYSSSMFDFAVTGKPMAFYTYDLERFRDSIRGFYFDLEPIAPGPMVTDPRDLADALLDLTALRSAFEDRYRSFQRTFCHLEDGHATDRLLAALGIGTTPRRSSSVEPMVAAP
jgi:CDP-glycerol glycerophosphotransferase